MSDGLENNNSNILPHGKKHQLDDVEVQQQDSTPSAPGYDPLETVTGKEETGKTFGDEITEEVNKDKVDGRIVPSEDSDGIRDGDLQAFDDLPYDEDEDYPRQ